MLCRTFDRLLEVLSNAVNLLVDLRAMMVAPLPAAGHMEGDPRGVPGADARDLPQAAVRLAHQTGHAPTGHHTVEALALGEERVINV